MLWGLPSMIDQTFEQASKSFGDFLVSMGWSRNVAWVFRDGITRHRQRFLFDVNACHSTSLDSDVEALYEEGRDRNLGVKFNAIADVNGTTLAY